MKSEAAGLSTGHNVHHDLTAHPAALAWPMLSDDDLQALAEVSP